MAGPNLLAALKHHLQTGEVPESIRETLGGGGTVQVPIEEQLAQSHQSHSHGQSPAYPLAGSFDAWDAKRPRRASAGGRGGRASGDKVTSGARISLEELAAAEGVVLEPEGAGKEGNHGVVGTTTLGDGDRRAAGLVGEADRPDRPAAAGVPPQSLSGQPGAPERAGAGQAAGAGSGVVAGGPLSPASPARQEEEPPLPFEEAVSLGITPAMMVRLGTDAPLRRFPPIGEQLKASLEAQEEAQPTPPAPEPNQGCELPITIAQLPQFAYICGPGGSGKTFWAKALANEEEGRVVLAATTGIASVNLGEGTTINSLCRYFDTASLREAYTSGYLESTLKKHRALGLERILIDEVSMMAGEQLTIITRAVDNVNQDKPEGVPELGVLCVGDFAQLSPVPDRDPRDPKGKKKLPVEFAFDSAEWERYGANVLRLTRIRRQEDREFVEALMAVRKGALAQAMAYFGPRLQQTTLMDFPGPTIVAKNDAVGKYNQLRLDAVKGAGVSFPSTRWGKVRPEWGGPPKPEHEWGIPPILQLKEGCRVMILANKNVAGKDEPPVWSYTNGDLGTFLGRDPLQVGGAYNGAPSGPAIVRLDRTGTEVRVGALERSNTIPMEPGRRKALREQGHPERIVQEGKAEAIGGITYTPLRLAYASTVHRSQGLSLNSVQINIRDPFFSQGGMLYVALSRARTAEGIRLVGTPEGLRARITVNPRIRTWL